MKVKELIEKLLETPQEAEVILYVQEDANDARNVKVFESDDLEKLPYVKGDYPDIKTKKIVIIGDYCLR